MEYSDIHRKLMQSFVDVPAQTVEQTAKNLAVIQREASGTEDNVIDLDATINCINSKITQDTWLRIKSGTCEVTGVKYFALINTSKASWMDTLTAYNENERSLFAKILDEIVRSDDGYASSISCLNMGSTFTPHLNQVTIEKTINKFVRNGWFVNKRGRLYVSVRCALELEPSLTEMYDIAQCILCKKPLFYGLHCSSCPEQGHKHCLTHYFNRPGISPQCPSCKVPWPGEDFDVPEPRRRSKK